MAGWLVRYYTLFVDTACMVVGFFPCLITGEFSSISIDLLLSLYHEIHIKHKYKVWEMCSFSSGGPGGAKPPEVIRLIVGGNALLHIYI